MAVEIKTPKCPRLNKNFRNDHYSENSDNNTPDLEVFVDLPNNITDTPLRIMCDEYQCEGEDVDQQYPSCRLKDKGIGMCIFSDWGEIPLE